MGLLSMVLIMVYGDCVDIGLFCFGGLSFVGDTDY